MYDWPEARAQTLADWDRIRAGVPGLPNSLSHTDDVQAHWRDPALVFSQTCWGPLSLGLIDWLLPLAQPDYSAFTGGRGRFYRSALIAREGVAMAVPDGPEAAVSVNLLTGRRLALNGRESLSGYLALTADLGADPCEGAECVHTGSHRASVRAVAEGRADIAAIDCRSWHLAQCFEPCAEALVVVGWTAERPGLPYVTSRATEPALARALREHLIDMGCYPVAIRRDG